jgi:hypothetical protein
MQDFLTFKTFITPTLLLVFYYMGAILIPFVSYYLGLWLKGRYFSKISTTLKDTIVINTTKKQRLLFIVLALLCFVCMELFWRVMFEFFIAYFDMHDALMQLS